MAERVLVTGGAGFIGSHLCEALVARGDEVIAFDNLSTGSRSNLGALEGESRFRLIEGDVLDAGAVVDAVRGCRRVYHLAAAVGVKLVMERAISTIITNTRGTEHVLEACAGAGGRVLLASSSEVYGKMGSAQAHPLAEGDDWRLGATSMRRWCYACTKAIDEFLALAYRDERGLEVVVARLFNTVGPRQTGQYGMVLPTFVRQALAGQPLTVYGDGSQSRSFTYVGDVVDALVALMSEPRAIGEVFNIGSTYEISITDLAERVVRLTDSRSPIHFIPYDEAYEAGFEDMPRRVPNITKIRELLGFHPKVELDDIIRSVIDYMRQH